MSPPASQRAWNDQDHPDGRIVRGDNRRAAILEAATREFGRRGYETARIADIARAAGVTDAGLLHHFPTKRDLFLAVVDLREAVYAPMFGQEMISVRSLFDALIAAVERAAENPDLVRFRAMLSGVAAIQGHPGHGRTSRNLQRGIAGMEPVLRAAMEAGELRNDIDPREVVLQLFALNDGIRNQSVAWDAVPYAETFRAAANALYDRIAAA